MNCRRLALTEVDPMRLHLDVRRPAARSRRGFTLTELLVVGRDMECGD